MKSEFIFDYIRDLEILIKKKLFIIGKKNGISVPPSPLQAGIFMYLLEHKEDTVYQKDLEVALKVSKVTMSEVLVKMENNGTIERISDEFDNRKRIIKYTKKGLVILEDMQKTIRTLNQDLIANLSEAEIQTFINVLTKMQNNIKE